MDLTYFETAIPVTGAILDIIIASGWALLLGNLVFQAAKSIMSGLGFEGEDPKTLFARTFVFGFFLLASRQICDIGLGISHTVITMLQVPDAVSLSIPAEDAFSIGASWLLVIIVGVVLMWQIVKLFFEIGERYFLVGLLTLLAPWAFAMGGSKSTADIFKGWVRMFASMCLMMVLNVIFLKMLLSAMSYMPSGAGVLPWMIFVVAIARVARKIDSVIARIGLNPALTGDGLGRGLPGMLSYMVIKSVASSVTKTAGGAAKSKTPPSGTRNPSGSSPAGTGAGSFNRSNTSNRGGAQSTSNTQTAQNNTSQQTNSGAAGTPPAGANTSAQTVTPGSAGMPPPINANTGAPSTGSGAAGTPPQNTGSPSAAANPGVAGKAPSSQTGAPQNAATPGAAGTGPSTTVRAGQQTASPGAAGTAAQGNTTVNQGNSGHQFNAGSRNTVSAGQNNIAGQKTPSAQKSGSRQSSVTHTGNARRPLLRNGAAGQPDGNSPKAGQNASTIHPPIPRAGQTTGVPASGVAGTIGAPGTGAQPTTNKTAGDGGAQRPARYSSIPAGSRSADKPGAAGTANISGGINNTRMQQGSTNVNAQNQSNVSIDGSTSQHEAHTVSGRGPSAAQKTSAAGARNTTSQTTPGAAGKDNRRSSVSADKPQGAAGQRDAVPNSRLRAEDGGLGQRHIGAAGTETRKSAAPSVPPASRPAAEIPRSGGNQPPVSPDARAVSGSTSPARQGGKPGATVASPQTNTPAGRERREQPKTQQPGAAGKTPSYTTPPAQKKGTARIGGIDSRKTKGIKKYRKEKGGK